MAESIREKLKKVYPSFGDKPPWWTKERDGLAYSNPTQIISGLNLDRFVGVGADWMTDIYNLMSLAVRSSILRNLYEDPFLNRSRRAVVISARAPLYNYSPSFMIKFVSSVLTAAEKTGRVALPEKLRVSLGGDQRSVWIEWDKG